MKMEINIYRYLAIAFTIILMFFIYTFNSIGAQKIRSNNSANLITNDSTKTGWPLITRRGDQLYERDKVFRFFGLDAPNIHQNETQIRTDLTNRFPDEYEIRDILSGIQREGGRATRIFTLSVFDPDDKGIPVYISARRTYNEEAFRCLDRVIAYCHEYDVRLIIPIIASQSFRGIRGVDEFAQLAGKPGSAFWTDKGIKSDFRDLLNFVLNRKNTVNGILYKDDPAVLAWQLGNEFGSYAGDRKLDYNVWTPVITKWCLEFAAYIKKLDPNHLIIDPGGCDRNALLNDPNYDIISDHLYEYWSRVSGGDWKLAPMAERSWNECKGKKPLIVDEFGLGSTENLRELMEMIRTGGITGGLLWSIRGHRRDGGWYYHNEGGTEVNSFHIPGSNCGYAYDEIRMLDLLRKESYKIRSIEPPPIEAPSPAPVLIKEGEGFTWRGSTGASSYTVERSESPDGPWIVIANGLNDAVIFDVKSYEYSPEASSPTVLYVDESATEGNKYCYRIKGVNISGNSKYSNVLEVQK